MKFVAATDLISAMMNGKLLWNMHSIPLLNQTDSRISNTNMKIINNVRRKARQIHMGVQ